MANDKTLALALDYELNGCARYDADAAPWKTMAALVRQVAKAHDALAARVAELEAATPAAEESRQRAWYEERAEQAARAQADDTEAQARAEAAERAMVAAAAEGTPWRWEQRDSEALGWPHLEVGDGTILVASLVSGRHTTSLVVDVFEDGTACERLMGGNEGIVRVGAWLDDVDENGRVSRPLTPELLTERVERLIADYDALLVGRRGLLAELRRR